MVSTRWLYIPVKTTVVFMLAQRLRRWSNIKPTEGESHLLLSVCTDRSNPPTWPGCIAPGVLFITGRPMYMMRHSCVILPAVPAPPPRPPPQLT